jgi:hypothetical protein
MGEKKPNSSCVPAGIYSGMDLLGGVHPLALARGGAGGVLFCMIKLKSKKLLQTK